MNKAKKSFHFSLKLEVDGKSILRLIDLEFCKSVLILSKEVYKFNI